MAEHVLPTNDANLTWYAESASYTIDPRRGRVTVLHVTAPNGTKIQIYMSAKGRSLRFFVGDDEYVKETKR